MTSAMSSAMTNAMTGAAKAGFSDTVNATHKRALGAVDLRWIVSGLLGWVALDNILLLAFLGLDPVLVAGLAVVAIGGLSFLVLHLSKGQPNVSIPTTTILICFAIALALLILGGEGRLLYANADWEIRDAVLRDMGNSAWPYAYQIGDNIQILRAPIGMYLKPALLGGPSQPGRDVALLLCNSVMLGGILAAGSILFNSNRARVIALIVFVVFSGLDSIGTIIVQTMGATPSFDHLEAWLPGSQYSSNITQIFWVPQHAFAGWLCAILYLCWERGYLRFSLFMAAIPILAIWSPLAIMGAVPFALYAGMKSLWLRDVKPAEIALGVVSIAVALPSLLYLRVGISDVKSTVFMMPLVAILLLLTLEILPFIVALRAQSVIGQFQSATILITLICLIMMPFYHIGPSTDFQMRASIMPLAICALACAILLGGNSPTEKSYRIVMGILLMIGASTGLMEIKRAFAMRPAPITQCSLTQAYFQQSGLVAPTSSYFAPVDLLPELLRPKNPDVIAAEPVKCWSRNWKSPRSKTTGS